MPGAWDILCPSLVSYDGTGYGINHTLWGSEFLIADTTTFTRAAHFDYFKLPGGEHAINNPWKIGLSLVAMYGNKQ